jgi:hypothetical protein
MPNEKSETYILLNIFLTITLIVSATIDSYRMPLAYNFSKRFSNYCFITNKLTAISMQLLKE